MKGNNNLHEGHRGRLKNRFLESGLDSFEPHNILELLLFYSIPRKDTNDIAHELIERFGSFSAVFNASVEELMTVNYITENSATLIKLIPAISRAYLMDQLSEDRKLDTYDAIRDYLLRLFHGATNECVYVLLFNNGYELLSCEKLYEGSVNSSHLSTRKLMELIVKNNASMVVLAHNHPQGAALPSLEDVETTWSIKDFLDRVNVTLLEHLVVNSFDCYPIIHQSLSASSLDEENKYIFRKV